MRMITYLQTYMCKGILRGALHSSIPTNFIKFPFTLLWRFLHSTATSADLPQALDLSAESGHISITLAEYQPVLNESAIFGQCKATFTSNIAHSSL